MGLPKTAEARLYYRAAKQRLGDANMLLAGGRVTGAMYLAGYTVECILKALVLAGVAPNVRKQLLGEFRGSRGHNVEWLAGQYRLHARGIIPQAIVQHLWRITSWSTDMRYATGISKRLDVNKFMGSVMAIESWADGRI